MDDTNSIPDKFKFYHFKNPNEIYQAEKVDDLFKVSWKWKDWNDSTTYPCSSVNKNIEDGTWVICK